VRASSFVRFGTAFAFVLAMLGAPLAAQSSEGELAKRERAEAILVRAEAEDEALQLARALADYDEGRALDPGSARAPRAEARAAMLRSHAEADFVPLAKLERVRRDPALSSDPRAVDALVREADAFPPGLVRVEVWVLAAEAFAHRFDRPRDAATLLQRVLVDPRTDPVLGQKAARDLVALELARGDLAAAEAAVHLAGTRADPRLAREVARAIRRRHMHHASLATLLLMLLVAARSWAAAARRGALGRVSGALQGTWKLAVGYAAYVALGGALLASGYEAGTARPFLYFGAALVPIVLVARAWSAAGSATPAARGGRALLSALGVLASAFLVLEAVDVAFLEGMGL
jgi:hypothetical protein